MQGLNQKLRKSYWEGTKISEYVDSLVEKETSMLNERVTQTSTMQQD